MAHPGYTKAEKCWRFLIDWWMRQKNAPELLKPDLHRRVGELLNDDPNAQDEARCLALWKEVEGGVQIPPEYRTIPITLKTAAKLLGYSDRRGDKTGVEMLSKAIRDCSIRAEKRNRQQYIFDRREFPEETQSEITLKQ